MLKIVTAAAGMVILFAMIKSKHIVKSLLLSSLQGLAALFAVNLVGEFIGIRLAVNWFSLAVSAVGGLPGVIFMLLCRIITLI